MKLKLPALSDAGAQIGVSLAMRVGRLVHRHAIHLGRKIGAVIEVIAVQQILIGFALATVKRHDQARDGLQRLPGSILRGQLQLGLIHHAFAGGTGTAEQVQPLGADGHLIEQAAALGALLSGPLAAEAVPAMPMATQTSPGAATPNGRSRRAGATFSTVVDKTNNDVTRYTEFDEIHPTPATRYVRRVLTAGHRPRANRSGSSSSRSSADIASDSHEEAASARYRR